jgi:hypothetical protein
VYVQQVSYPFAREAAPDHSVTTALSTAEAEYYSAATAATEVLYLRLLENMGFAQPGPTPMYEDNTACIEWGNRVIVARERAKHTDIWKHLARQVIHNGHMKLIRVATANQLADILTKPLHFPQCMVNSEPPHFDWAHFFTYIQLYNNFEALKGPQQISRGIKNKQEY